MKKLLLSLLFIGVISAHAQNAILAKWTFENISITTSITGSNLTLDNGSSNNADEGVYATTSSFTAFHNDSQTIWSTPSGNGSSKSISATRWTADDYFQFKTSTTGQSNIFIQFDAASSGTGPKNFRIEYSTNGSTYLPTNSSYENMLVASSPAANNWNNTLKPTFTHVFNLSAISNLNNKTDVYFRLYCTGNTSQNDGTIASGGTSRVDNVTISNYNVLPVSLTSFTAKANLKNVDLAWNTSSEKDNSHFEIFRSGDGKTFSKIGEVKGSGTTEIAQDYTFVDKNALPGTSYYQLSQVDYDGKSTPSKVEAVKSNVTASNFKIAANKQEGTIKLTVFAANEGLASFKIYDLNGRKVAEKELSLSKGYSNVSVPFNSGNGLHIASLTTANETITQKFIQ